MTFFTPEDIEHYEFLLGVPGYNRAEVRVFLQAVAEQFRQTGGEAPEPSVADHGDLDDDRLVAAERAIGELIRGAEIHIEDVANRVVGEVESVRAEIAQLLRAMDQRSTQLTRAVQPPRLTTPVEEPLDLPPVSESEAPPEPELVATEPEDTTTSEIPAEWDELFAEPRMEPS